MALRAPKVFGALEKRVPGQSCSTSYNQNIKQTSVHMETYFLNESFKKD